MSMYKVFLVDDEPYILQGLRTIFNWSEYGMEICGQAINGIDALNSIETIKPDILITDIKMPKMGGIELIQKIKELDFKMKYIVLSGYNEFEFVKQGIALGIENYLLKPISIQELLSTVSSTCEKLDSLKYREIHEKKDNIILKENVLYRWATNKIDALELHERSTFLHICLDHTYYTTSMIRVSSTLDYNGCSTNMELPSPSHEIYDICCNVVGQNESIMCFLNLDGEIVITWGIDSIEAGKLLIDEKLNLILENVNGIKETDIFITVGDFQSGFINLYKSYFRAKKMQEYSLISPKNKIYYYNESNFPEDTITSFRKVDYQQFSRLLLTKNKPMVFDFINDIFNKLRSCRNITPSYIQSCCMEMVFHINKTFNNLDLNYNVMGNDYKELFFSMIEITTLTQLENIIISIADNAINCFITENNKVSPVIKQVLKYINEQYMDELSLKTLGYALNINPVYLGQLFQKETKQHFNEYVNEFKMQKAQQLLLNTNLKAVDISKKVGFMDPNYFFKQFKKYVGVSPTELRGFKKPI